MISPVDTPATSDGSAHPPTENPLRKKALSAINNLPPFSPILNKLMATLASDPSFATLGDLIEKDTVVAGNVLNIVNSAMYARRKEITSVRHALSILGTEKIRNLVIGMSISNMMKQAKPHSTLSMKRFNTHSARVAILSDLLVQHIPCHYPEGAFVAGLLHDVGKLLLALGLPVEFKRLLEEFQNSNDPWITCEQNRLGFTHAELSHDILLRWQVPEPIRTAALEHHVDWSGQPLPTQEHPAPLARILDAANQYINATGGEILNLEKLGRSPEEFSRTNPPRIALLGLTDADLDRILATYEEENEAMAAFFV